MPKDMMECTELNCCTDMSLWFAPLMMLSEVHHFCGRGSKSKKECQHDYQRNQVIDQDEFVRLLHDLALADV